jgi:predicted enzyme related to lactoylglutathione lyase
MPAKATRPKSSSRARSKTAAFGADVPKLARIIVHVGDLDRGTQFYSTLLGTNGRAVGGGRVYFDCGPVIVAILDPTSGGAQARPLPDTVYFTVRDLEKVHERAGKLGCLDKSEVHGDPAGDIVVRPWGERSFYAVDPWGNALCFADEKTLFTGNR